MTTAPLARRLVTPIRSTLSGSRMVVGFAATLLVGAAVLAGTSAVVAVAYADAILPGVSIGGVEVGGLRREEAAARLAASLPSLADGEATVTAGDRRLVVAWADIGRRDDPDAMLDAAFGVGRGGGLLGDAIVRLRSLLRPTELPVAVHAYDAGALSSVSSEIARSVSAAPVEASASLDGTQVTVSPSRDGRYLAASTVASALGRAAAGINPGDAALTLVPSVVRPAVTTELATAAATAADRMIGNLRLAIPGAGADEDVELSAERIASWIDFGPRAGSRYAARVDRLALAAAVLQMREPIDRAPVNARFATAGSGLGEVVPGIEGRALETTAAIRAIERALADRAAGEAVYRVHLPVTLTQPALTTAAAEAALPHMQLVSSWTTNYVPNDGNGYGANISIGAWDLDGYTIAPGEWFSFWDGIGPVTLERGYTYGGAIINGRSVANGALAGGICSTSTTLFNAAMRFGLEIGERENHYYYIDRYPVGLDATVAIVDDSVTDMTFRNDTDAPIVIRGFAVPGRVTFQLWSVPHGRQIVLSAPHISNRRAARDTVQLVPSMAPGSARRIEFPHDGFDVSVTRTVYDANGEVIHHDTWFSDYRPVDGITLVGPALPAPEPPPGDGAGTGD